MADGGRRVDAYYARGMLEIRSTLHLALRLAVRLNQLLPRSGAASSGGGPWRAAVAAFVIVDVVVWLVLRRSDRFGLSWRLPLDAVDCGFWALSPHPAGGSYDWAVLIAVPLAVEAGVRLGWRGHVVPSVVFLVTGLSATLAGKAVQVTGVCWIVLAVAMGAAAFRYCRLLDQRAEHGRRRVLAAANRRAYLAGQNQVAMGASSAVDAIEGLVPVLGAPEAGSALWRLAAGWKTELSASTAKEAVYLQVALLQWERAHNHHPDLSGLVRAHVEEGHGTTLLTATQVRQMRRALAHLPLRGSVAVRLRDPGASHLPGRALDLDVDGHLVVVAADAQAAPRPVDPVAVTYCYPLALSLIGMFPQFGGVALPAAVLGGAVCAAAAVVSHRGIVKRGEGGRLRAFSVAVVAATVLTLLAGFARSPITAEGDPVLGFGTGLVVLSFLGGFYATSLGRWRWVMPVAVVGNVALGLAVFPVPSAITLRVVVAAVVYDLFPYFPFRHMARALHRAEAQHAEAIHAVDSEAERAAFFEGARSVVGLVREAREEALGQLRMVAPRLDVRIAALAAHRLEEVERRLRTIEPQPEWSSSTTTS
jgi:hypothetical protein